MENAKAIVLDIEFTGTDKYRTTLCFETLEIGAVKIDYDNDVIDDFNAIVKPDYSVGYQERLEHLSAKSLQYCKNNRFGSFVSEIKAFCEWVGDVPIDTYIWAPNDLQTLVSEIKTKCTDSEVAQLAPYFSKFIDLQQIFRVTFSYKNNPNLEVALARVKLEFEGEQHFAFDDAKNTAFLLKRMQTRYELITPKYLTYYGTLVSERGYLCKEANEESTTQLFMLVASNLREKYQNIALAS